MATDRIQINLDNDTANFRASQAALALAQTHRPQNTTKVYSRIEKEWRTWCRSCNFEDGDLVYEAKLVRFLSEEVVNRALKNSPRKRKRDENTSIEAAATSQRDDLFLSDVDEGAPPQTLKFQSIRTYKTGVMNLYFHQAARGLNNHPNPNGAALRSLMKVQRITQHQKAKEQHEDRGRGTIADGYNLKELEQISDSFWRHAADTKHLTSGCFLRSNLDFLLGHFLLLRGESRRRAELPDLQLLHLDNEGSTPAPCLLYIMSNGKTNQNGRIEYQGLLRHRHIQLCTFSAMANYFVWRWEQSGEEFPSFKAKKDWCDIQILVGSPQHTTKEISDTSQRMWINKIYRAPGIKISKITHAGRGSGAREAEKLDIDVDQIQRQGRWAGDSTHKGYFTSLPRQFMRGMAGFLPNHAGAYFVPRAQIEPPKELIQMIFPKLDQWLRREVDDIATKQFLKLLNYLCVVFLQDSVILRSRYPTHSLWFHDVFKHPLYLPFAADVASRLNDEHRDMDTQIRQAMPLLGQQMLNLNTSLSSQILGGFNQQREQTTRLESKIEDFLDGKIAFTLTPVKRQKILNLATKDAPIPIDQGLQPSSSPTNSASFAASTKEIVPSLTVERQRSSSSSSPPSSITYTLSRQVQTVTDLFKEWTVGLGNGPSIASLNDQYGYGWRRGWGSKDKEFYSKRLAVIKAIYTKASGGSLEAAVTAMEAERAAKGLSLNAFAVQLRKESNS